MSQICEPKFSNTDRSRINSLKSGVEIHMVAGSQHYQSHTTVFRPENHHGPRPKIGSDIEVGHLFFGFEAIYIPRAFVSWKISAINNSDRWENAWGTGFCRTVTGSPTDFNVEGQDFAFQGYWC